jgi:hypothetical protein
MLDVNIAVDTELGKHAIDAVADYVNEHAQSSYRSSDDWPIARSQISGLLQIAMREPEKLKDFAEKQEQKAKARREATREERQRKLDAEIEFWELIKNLCDGKPPKIRWSLAHVRENEVPAELQDDELPPGAKLTKEQQAARKEKGERRKQWLRQWNRDYFPAFFQRFAPITCT